MLESIITISHKFIYNIHKSILPVRGSWTVNVVTLLNRFCDIVERSHVLFHRVAENDLSAEALLHGFTFKKLTTCVI